jgi:hypothetical protein
MYINDEEITKFMDILTGKVNEKIEEEGEVEANKVLAFLRKRLAAEIAEEKKYEEIELTKVKKEEKGKEEKKKKSNVNGSSDSESGSDSGSKSSKQSSDDEKSEALLSKQSSSDSDSDTGTEEGDAKGKAVLSVAEMATLQRRKTILGHHKEGEAIEELAEPIN